MTATAATNEEVEQRPETTKKKGEVDAAAAHDQQSTRSGTTHT
jgi:hypothetical protein